MPSPRPIFSPVKSVNHRLWSGPTIIVKVPAERPGTKKFVLPKTKTESPTTCRASTMGNAVAHAWVRLSFMSQSPVNEGFTVLRERGRHKRLGSGIIHPKQKLWQCEMICIRLQDCQLLLNLVGVEKVTEIGG
jgi:hypothetical protein